MFTNLVLLSCYGVVSVTTVRVLAGNWSGIASIGNFAAAFFGVPFLIVRAWMLRRDLWARGLTRIRWLAIAGFPLSFVAFWSVGVAVSDR